MQGYQRKYLRGLAHDLKPVVQVGRSGATDAVVQAIDVALCDHELIKVRMYEPEDKRALAAELARATDSVECGLIGHTVILYRRHPDHPVIVVPDRDGEAGAAQGEPSSEASS
ncbi:MAG: YhbY family RNA-binding protein [Deltaproteobacteria bacterium]|jgi:RNA-binding protein|nr:YhbY family RNA-binding protein [Deltaproteobacteria bacterium]MBW2532947.1 YhbY family RNA-binding protein [Deltaproteobacteria bacterium]